MRKFLRNLEFITRSFIIIVALIGVTLNGISQEQIIKISNEGTTTSQNEKDDVPVNNKELLRSELKFKQNDKLIPVRSVIDNYGKHEKFQYYYKGIKVQGVIATVHTKNGKATEISTNYKQIPEIDVKASVSAKNALQSAKEKLSFKTIDLISKELIVLPIDPEQNIWKLAYNLHIKGANFDEDVNVYIDAKTGDLIKIISKIKHLGTYSHANRHSKSTDANNTLKQKSFVDLAKQEKLGPLAPATGTLATRYSGTLSLTTDSFQGQYRLRDYSRGSGIINYNNASSGQFLQYIDYTDSNNDWTLAEHDNATKDNAAFDALFASQVTYDYFLNEHGRNSYDGSGSVITNFVNILNYQNAGWSSGNMLYGDGIFGSDPLTSLDVGAHEMGHGVTEFTANLDYEREQGGINESLSDIWAMSVEHYANINYGLNKDLDLLGNDFGYTLRSMANPKAYGQPDTYRGTNWVAATVSEGCSVPQGGAGGNDYCGVHTNSGVGNFWYYTLTLGGSGINDNADSYSVTAIGIDKGGNIVYASLQYLTPTSQYADFRAATIQAAQDLYGADSQEEIQVTNAWYAVGVGAAYSGNTGDTQAPTVPTGLTSSNITASGFDMSWNASTDNVEVTEYEVFIDGASSGLTTTTSYTASGLNNNTTYAVTVIAKDAAGNQSGLSNSIDVTTLQGNGGGCTNATYNSDDFEGGFFSSIWNDGGSDARISTSDQAFANSGIRCVRLRDDQNSANITTDNLDLSSFEELTVTFSYITAGLENGEGFSLQISTNGGASFNLEESWTRGNEFASNNSRQSGTATISGPFTSTTKLRFKHNASINNDRSYLDDVVIEGCSNGTSNIIASNNVNNFTETSIEESKPAIESIKAYPIPVNQILNIKNVPVKSNLKLLSISGQLLIEAKGESQIDMSGFKTGIYILQINTEEQTKFIKVVKK
ncbi:M4 family metallopeptidase [Flavivirga amylovorans]|uniref:M4 family metallopeptidase n=1 Tax=Flavivirga amylovorans TaxID=870486 RepID=A0ABT8X2I2_9FLAO|nr:M4 family metallopeptidase [Flavivirga amylovorans]MDO5987775.1 M4 family metallopeptidase [Flavivirga amylovorans]